MKKRISPKSKTGSRGEKCQAHVMRLDTKCLVLQRGIHVLYLQFDSLQTQTESVCHVLVLGTNFICIT